MYYGHLQLKPLKGVSGQEPTAFTKQTIKQLLAEEAEAAQANATDAPATETVDLIPAQEKPAPAPQAALQSPPQLHKATTKPTARPIVAKPEPVAAPVAEIPTPKPRSFLQRLIRN